ncbi:MAG: hypothetical protein ACPG5T_00490 [Endozoicomonas sp.]
MSQEIDDIFNEALTEIHTSMDEAGGFNHRPANESADTNDTDFQGIFWLKQTGIDDQDDDFLNSYEFDAVIDVMADTEIQFNSGDQIYRYYGKATWDVLISYKIHGEIRILVTKTEQTMMGMN